MPRAILFTLVIFSSIVQGEDTKSFKQEGKVLSVLKSYIACVDEKNVEDHTRKDVDDHDDDDDDDDADDNEDIDLSPTFSCRKIIMKNSSRSRVLNSALDRTSRFTLDTTTTDGPVDNESISGESSKTFVQRFGFA